MQGKKFRDRERILAVFDQADKFVDLNAGSNLLNAAKTLAKPVIREKLRQFIKTMANTDSDRLDSFPEFIERLAKNYSWEDLARKLIELDVDGEISSQLSSVQKLLIPALMMFRQQLSSGETVNPELYEKLLGSLRVPRSVLIDNLGDLARLAAGLALRMDDENTAEDKVAPPHPG